MLVGIMSDTHDHLDNMKKAVALFQEKGVSHIIHAGDFTSPFAFRALKGFQGGLTAIFGNNDGDRIMIKKMFGESVHVQPYVFSLHERKFVVVHEHYVVDALAASGMYDVVVYGHTHEPVIKTVGNTLVLNPGEACGWLYGKPTVALLNLDNLNAEIVPLF
ncbi:MAG TPA: metallophosphoesterase [Dissulfurispiraceae bacterium]|nr:metallophosphoesterase [Dissulfurispiraceae bacterium]